MSLSCPKCRGRFIPMRGLWVYVERSWWLPWAARWRRRLVAEICACEGCQRVWEVDVASGSLSMFKDAPAASLASWEPEEKRAERAPDPPANFLEVDRPVV